jgi:transcriptional regulator with XRE-family HTH domain
MKRTNPIDKHVGARVRMRRLMLNMSQSEIGNALGLTFQQIQKYENGVNRISASRLQLLCAVLKVPVPFFFEGLPDAPETDGETAALDSFFATSEGVAMAVAFGRIRDPKVRRASLRWSSRSLPSRKARRFSSAAQVGAARYPATYPSSQFRLPADWRALPEYRKRHQFDTGPRPIRVNMRE